MKTAAKKGSRPAAGEGAGEWDLRLYVAGQ